MTERVEILINQVSDMATRFRAARLLFLAFPPNSPCSLPPPISPSHPFVTAPTASQLFVLRAHQAVSLLPSVKQLKYML